MAGITSLGVSMHLLACVAIHAFHAALTEVHICQKIIMFAQVFVTYPATMTGGTVARHRRLPVKGMAADETPTHRGWLGDMAITTASVASITMVSKHFF